MTMNKAFRSILAAHIKTSCIKARCRSMLIKIMALIRNSSQCQSLILESVLACLMQKSSVFFLFSFHFLSFFFSFFYHCYFSLLFIFFFFRNVAFGCGRRACVGENLARNRAFLFLACLMQKFTLTPADGHPLPPQDPREYAAGLSIRPKPYVISAKLRTQTD